MDVLAALARPAEGPEGAANKTLVDDRVQAHGDLPDGRDGVADQRRSAEQETLDGVDVLNSVDRGLRDQVDNSRLVALGLHALLDRLCHGGGVTVRRRVRDHDDVLALGLGAPLAVLVGVRLDVRAEDRPVRAAHDLDVQVLDLVQRGNHEALERAHDGVEVVLIRVPHLGLLLGVLREDFVVEEVLVAVVSAEEVARDERLQLGDVGHHRVRPVDHRRRDELEGVVAERQLQARGRVHLFHLGRELVGDVGNVGVRNSGGDDGRVGVLRHEGVEGAGVVRLGVVQHDVLDLLVRLQDGLDVADVLGGELLLGGLEHRDAVRAAQQVRVVRSAVRGVHHNVEHTQLSVEDTNPVEVFANFSGFHCS